MPKFHAFSYLFAEVQDKTHGINADTGNSLSQPFKWAVADLMLRELIQSLVKTVRGDVVGMPLVAVQSKSLAGIGYHSQSKTLGLEYFNGLVYEIKEFPEAKYKRLQDADCLDVEFEKIVLAEFELKKVGRAAPIVR